MKKNVFISYRSVEAEKAYMVKGILEKNKIPYTKHIATRLEKEDYEKYDLFVCMDENNIRNTLNIFKNDPEKKIMKLLKNKDVKDPWYTGNFFETYKDINEGTEELLQMLKFNI